MRSGYLVSLTLALGAVGCTGLTDDSSAPELRTESGRAGARAAERRGGSDAALRHHGLSDGGSTAALRGVGGPVSDASALSWDAAQPSPPAKPVERLLPTPPDDTLIAPEGLTVLALQGGTGVLEVTALTLVEGQSAPELFATVRNRGERHACSAALSVELYDWREQSVAVGVGGLLSQEFYRLTEGPGEGEVASCIAPGGVSAAAIVGLPSTFGVADIGFVVYRTPYFALDVVGPIAGLKVQSVERRVSPEGPQYVGTVVNGFDVSVSVLSAHIFPLTVAGRPLGVASAEFPLELMPAGRWRFATGPTAAGAGSTLAFVAGAIGR